MLGIYTRLSKQDEESNSINNQLREGKQFATDFHYSDIKIYNEGEGVCWFNKIIPFRCPF